MYSPVIKDFDSKYTVPTLPLVKMIILNHAILTPLVENMKVLRPKL